MTAASGCRTVEAGRSGLSLRIVLALSAGVAGRSAVRAARPSDVAARGIPCESSETADARSGP